MLFKGTSFFSALAAISFSRAEPFVQFGIGHYEQHFCAIILNFDQWSRRRCRLTIFLVLALTVNLLNRVKPFVQFWYRSLWGAFM